MSTPLLVSSSPHIKTSIDTQRIMAWVLIALAPAGVAGWWIFGVRALAVMAVSVAACVVSEFIWQKCCGQPVRICDLSAAVTGLLLAYNVPVTIPLWMPAVGGAFAIIIAKGFFGGLGQNIVNPALAGRAMLLTCWPVAMTNWAVPAKSFTAWLGADAETGPTLLNMIKHLDPEVVHFDAISSASIAGSGGAEATLADAFFGTMGGCIGETCALALLIGGAILIWKKVISWRIPVIYVATVAALSAITTFGFGRASDPLFEIFAGGLMLGAIFMATDYATSPMTAKGQAIFAIGCGILTTLIRTNGAYPEGVSYSILIMNITVPLIDRFTRQKILGEVRRDG